MQQENAETIALRALSWLATNDELLPVFMGATGTATEDFQNRAAEPDFLLSILDFIMMDDAWVVEFCDTERLGYDQLMIARQALPGGAVMHWT